MKYVTISREDEKSKELEAKIRERIKGTYTTENPDICIAVGGDGTLLGASHLYPNAIIFGIHTGHLGFYCNYMDGDVDTLVSDINNSTYKVDEIEQLRCDMKDSKGKLITNYALNEIAIITPVGTAMLDVFISGEYLERFRGSGFCISTPTGSTGFNKSLDGAVVDLSIKGMQLTEIAGINSNAYRSLKSSLILAADKRIKLVSPENSHVFITVDNMPYDIKDFDSLEVYYDNHKLKMAYHNLESYLKRINRAFSILKE